MCAFVTEANLGSGVNVIRSLGKRGINVTAGDVSKIAGGFWSKYCNNRIVYPDPYFQERFIKAIIKAKKMFDFDVIYGMSDITIRPIVRYKNELERNEIIVPTPDSDTFFKMCDKYATYKIAEKVGIPYPDTIIPDDEKEALHFSKTIGFPIVVKARNLTGGRGIFYTRNKEEFLKAYRNIKKILGINPVIQEYIPGRRNVYSVPVIFNRNNQVVTSLVMRKIRESPISGGTATFAETVSFPILEKYTIKMLKNIGWLGIATAEFKLDPRDNIPKLMEINPRFFGYMNLAIWAGIDLPYILYKIGKNEKICKKNICKKMAFSRLTHDLYVGFKELTEKNLNFTQRKKIIDDFLNSYQNKKMVFDYLSLNDPLPFLSSILCMLGREIGYIKKPYEQIQKKW